jgi:hypothetical protein
VTPPKGPSPAKQESKESASPAAESKTDVSFEVQMSVELDISAMEEDAAAPSPVPQAKAHAPTDAAADTSADDETVPTPPKVRSASRGAASLASSSGGTSVTTNTGKGTLLVLISRKSLDHAVVANQLYMFTVLGAKRIPYEVLDCSESSNDNQRDEMFAMSGCMDKFPQFFYRKDDGSIAFWGHWTRFVEANEKGKLSKELRRADISISMNDALSCE